MSKRYREVIIFVAGLMKDSRPLVKFVYEMQVEDHLNKMRTGGLTLIDADLLKWLQAESSVRLVDDLLHNKYINYYRQDECGDPTDTTPVYCPSRLYHFEWMRHEVVLENHLTQGEEIPPYTMKISFPDEAVSDSLLSICSEIAKRQTMTDLWMCNVNCGDATESPILSRNIQSLGVLSCHLSRTFMKNVLQQLHNCDTLTHLVLIFVDLSEVEEDLDELFDNLVCIHEKGLSQKNLWIMMERNGLSKAFEAK